MHSFSNHTSSIIALLLVIFHICKASSCLAETALVKVNEKGKVKLSLCFNFAPRHKGVLGEWRYSSTHYWSR